MRVILPSRPACQNTGTLIPGWHQQSTRWFFTSKSQSAVYPSSPILRTQSSARLKSTSATQRFRVKKATGKASDDVWPLGILLDARKLGLLKISVDAAIGVMRDFHGHQSLSADQICKSIPKSLHLGLERLLIDGRARNSTKRYHPSSSCTASHRAYKYGARHVYRCCQAS